MQPNRLLFIIILDIYMNTIKTFALLFLMTLLPLCAIAQEDEGFTADRPGATTGTDVLPKGRFQWETGMGWERSKMEGVTATVWTLNTSLLRWGISEHAELRLQGDWLNESVEGEHYNGLSGLAIGTKMKLFEGWKAVPVISLLANILVPGGSDSNFLPENWGGQVGILFQNELTPWLSLGYEGDLIWSDDSRPAAFFGACLGFQVNDRLSLMVEEYNTNNQDGTSCWMEIGGAWQLSSRVQLDVATDISLQYPSRFANVMVGVAWQITKR